MVSLDIKVKLFIAPESVLPYPVLFPPLSSMHQSILETQAHLKKDHFLY